MKIVLEHVTKRIKKRTVLNDINLTLESGNVYGLKGHNGSGKTMLLRMISGIIRATEGNVFVDGLQLGKEIDYPDSMGILIENPAFLDEFSGRKNLEMIASLNEIIGPEEIQRTLELVGLKGAEETSYHKYSLGMKQRLGIAAAIMENPQLILLDEPTNALDDEGIESMVELIKELRKDERIIVVASHEQEFLKKVTDCIYTMKDGRILSEGD